MKILKLIETTDKFTTTLTDKDPQTGTLTWDVEYTPLKSLDTNLEKIYTDFKKAADKHPEDQKLQSFLDTFALFKKLLRRHITQTYGKR
jgi:hypothetical protein